ncbi:hypothetical protein BGW39_004389 [Mortierella sp. 14UC]|nr:hypothetical protein BGW39_004389 [Mortierella sp. 14UC]
MAGYCLRGDNCWFSHDRAIIEGRSRGNGAEEEAAPGQSSSELTSTTGDASANGYIDGEDENEDHKCAICFEVPSTFGLLVSCNHAFCLTCIRTWRSKNIEQDVRSSEQERTSVTKACPNCRTQSLFVVPSSYFPATPEQKDTIIKNYKRQHHHHHHNYMGGRNLFRRRAGLEGYSGYSDYGGGRHRELMEDLAFIQMSAADIPHNQLQGIQGLLVQLARLSVEDPNFDPNIHPQLRTFSEAFEEYPGRHVLRGIGLDDYYGEDGDEDDYNYDEDEDDLEDEDEDEDAESETTLERDEREDYEEFGNDLYFQAHFQSSAPQDNWSSGASGGWADHDIDAYHDGVWAEHEDYY